MKRLVLALALLVGPVLFAQSGDRSLLLAPEGTLYTVESELGGDNPLIDSVRYLSLTIQKEGQTRIVAVPASMSGGNNWQPELAYDSESKTLLVFWLRSKNSILGASELLFCTYHDGKFAEVASIDNVPYHFRYNLRVGVTQTVQAEVEGLIKQVPGLTVHVVWWDDSAAVEIARYAMLTVEKGQVTDRYLRDLPDFVNRAYQRDFAADPSSREVLRHPLVLESPTRDTVDVIFGNVQSNTLHRVTLKPVLDTRVRIPIGIRDVSYPAPHDNKFAPDSNSRISAIPTTGDRLALYVPDGGRVKYVVFEDGKWQASQSIAVTEKVSAAEAVAAFRKMVNGD